MSDTQQSQNHMLYFTWKTQNYKWRHKIKKKVAEKIKALRRETTGNRWKFSMEGGCRMKEAIYSINYRLDINRYSSKWKKVLHITNISTINIQINTAVG